MLEQAHDLCTVNLHVCVHVCDMVARGVVSMHKRKANPLSYTTNHFSVEVLWVSVVKVG